MRQEPFIMLGLYAVAGADAAKRYPEYQVELIVMMAVGGMIALCFSIWKSKRKKADRVDTAIWAMIALLGSTALAYLLGPWLHGTAVPGTELVLTAPLVAFFTAISATPVIEWVLTGELWKLVRDKLVAGISAALVATFPSLGGKG